MFKTMTPPRMFAMVSLAMIIIMVVGIGLIQAPYFRQSIIDREAVVVRDLVNALSVEHGVMASDFQDPASGQARRRFDSSFGTLKWLHGTTRIKVFNRDNTIVWSDEAALVGAKRTTHLARLALAMGGEVQAVFNAARKVNGATDAGPAAMGTIECYVPIYVPQAGDGRTEVMGVLSLYRDPKDLNQTIRQDLYLLWAVVSGAGVLLFLALYKFFSLVYVRQKTAESRFSKLTLEHERIVQIEKMSAMGELVGEIAHQLNNPLVGVINMAQLAERQVHDPQRVLELLVQVRKAGTECRDIVQRILRINQISRSELAPTDIQDLVRDTITFCQQSVDMKQGVDFVAPEQKIRLNIDPVLVRQALFNLIHNAILAAPDRQVHVALTPCARDGIDGIQISVTDAGPGFGSEVAARLFKPFFTTRSSGTGLGLSVAQHIAIKHGGVVLAENLAEGGARFSIWLPSGTTP